MKPCSHDHETLSIPPHPSSTLWAAALSGLLGVGGAACGDKPKVEPDPVPDAKVVAADAAVDAVPVAPPDAFVPPSKIISETVGNLTFAEITAMCDQRGGYTTISGGCSGSNICAGFSYGDWDPGVLTEHSCNAVSGCNGISCVVLPPDSGKTALDILGASLPDTEGVAQRSCNYCHAEWTATSFDPTVFKVKVAPGSGRTLANWLDNPPEAQARTIAFGRHGVYPIGSPGQKIAYTHMAPYYKMYSRAEIERVVTYIRTQATIHISDIKVEDPAMFQHASGMHRPRHPGVTTAIAKP